MVTNTPKIVNNFHCIDAVKNQLCVLRGDDKSDNQCAQYLGGPLVEYDHLEQMYSLLGIGIRTTNEHCNVKKQYIPIKPISSLNKWLYHQLGKYTFIMKTVKLYSVVTKSNLLDGCHCPQCNIDEDSMVSCQQDTLDTFPNGLLNLCPHMEQKMGTFKWVNLQGQKITQLQIEDLHRMNTLIELNLSSNKITRVLNDFATIDHPNLPLFIKLNLTQNDLSHISDGCFDGLPYLTEIDVRQNPIRMYTTLSWTICYMYEQNLSKSPFIGNMTIYKYYGHDLQHLQLIENDFCETLGKKHFDSVKNQCYEEEDGRILNCSRLDQTLESINLLSCLKRKISAKKVILKLPKDNEIKHSLDNLEACKRIDPFNKMNKEMKKFHKIQRNLTLNAIVFNLSTLYDHVNLSVIEEVTIQADTVVLNQPLKVSFRLNIRARKIILTEPIIIEVNTAYIQNYTNSLFIERHIHLKDQVHIRHRKYTLVDLVDSLPHSYIPSATCSPKTFEASELDKNDNWYNVMATNLMYVCSYTLMQDKKTSLAQKVATWQLEFNRQARIKMAFPAFATTRKYENLIFFAQQPNTHHVPSVSLANIQKLANVLYDQFDDYAILQKHQQENMTAIQTNMNMIFANMALANQSAQQYYEGELQSIERLFSTIQTQMNWTFEDRKASTQVLLDSTQEIQQGLHSIGKNNLKAILTMAESSKNVSQVQLKPLRENEADRTGRLKYSKDEMLRLQTKLKQQSKDLKTTTDDLKKQMDREIAIQAIKGIVGIGAAVASFGMGPNPADAAEKAAKRFALMEKLVKLIAKLATMLYNIGTGIMETGEFSRSINFEDISVNSTSTFLESVKQAYEMKKAKSDFDELKTTGQVMYDNINKDTEYVDAGPLLKAIFGIVDTGRDLVTEVSFYP